MTRRESRVVDYQEIYRSQASAYERLVAHEDHRGNLLPALQAIRPLAGLEVVKLGAGTGRLAPQPPSPGLAAYYRWLEETLGFNHTWIRTDYRFPTHQEAVAAARFFFGDEMAGVIRRRGGVDLPECTGIWWLPVYSVLE